MTIEGLGKKFQEARQARNLTLEEAARMTKIRPSRLAEIEADDFSQFPSLAYAKGFLLIYGKFLDVDVTPYMEAFEGSDAVTVDGYSYLQDNPAPKPVRAAVVPRRSRPRPVAPSGGGGGGGGPVSIMPLVIGAAVIIVGYLGMKLLLNLQRLAPHHPEPTPAPQVQATISAPSYTPASTPFASATPRTERAVAVNTPPIVAPSAEPMATPTPASTVAITAASPAATALAVATPSATATAAEPEVRRAQPVRPEDLAKSTTTAAAGPNHVTIRPLKKTYIKVVVDNGANTPAFERWITPENGAVDFNGQHFAVRVLERDAVQIKKNGKTVSPDDADVTVE
jgi:cytoskeletal protein RodZ